MSSANYMSYEQFDEMIENFKTEKRQEFYESVDKTHYSHLQKWNITLYGNSCRIDEQAIDMIQFMDSLKKIDVSKLEKRDENLCSIQYWFGQFSYFQNFTPNTVKPPERKHGDIKTFSPKARLRMLKKLNMVDFNSGRKPFFITLTYPGRYPTKRERYKRDIDVFLKRMKREFGEISYMWRLEAQKRGAPHYHLIVYTSKDKMVEYTRKWISFAWYEIVQTGWEVKMEEHLRVGTNVQVLNSIKMATIYVSKYMSKEQEDKLIDQGRYWATSRNWGDLILENFELTGNQANAFRRLLSRYLRFKSQTMSRRVKNNRNIEVWGNYVFMFNALKWVVINY